MVWQGLHPGVYNNWEDCKEQVEGQSGAKYKAFESREAAELYPKESDSEDGLWKDDEGENSGHRTTYQQ